ncbi:MAG: BON domain-containing protein [Chitinophagaceae bacterium]|nr:BON domain-containing protein [Chitinophagaceae bacterium]
MKKLSTSILLMGILALTISFTSCKKKAKDADIKAAIETALKADPMSVNTMVSVDKGVATISGECKDEACKMHCADMVKGIKGVKEVVNNCTVAAPMPVINAEDEALTKGLNDALKDQPGVKFSINEGKIVLTGEIAKAKWAAVKQMLDKLKPKGYDLTGLTIK